MVQQEKDLNKEKMNIAGLSWGSENSTRSDGIQKEIVCIVTNIPNSQIDGIEAWCNGETYDLSELPCSKIRGTQFYMYQIVANSDNVDIKYSVYTSHIPTIPDKHPHWILGKLASPPNCTSTTTITMTRDYEIVVGWNY